jgi:hypothetical protein
LRVGAHGPGLGGLAPGVIASPRYLPAHSKIST